ncbi:NACHT domain-containing protein [Streptomyces cinnabarinus]|uniref:NACHT domain-containing protein n=1 Tax=Streptomyces cinnabarinus TaxID=67287 RepID=A0ABY7KHN6_9ACTN|nr:NACHT domain-containing protein [Streptomyces cinnabarinus]WAZ23090.1 NACHT domain-containing protein [Streptomyces cinnabarinus]
MPEQRDDGFGTKHEISGSGTYQGPVIQARDITGPVHFDSPRPEERPAGTRSAPQRTAGTIVLLGVLIFVITSLRAGEEMLSPGARRVLALAGAALVVTGSLWWATVLVGLPAWLRERRAPRRRLTPAQLDATAASLASVLAEEYARDEKQLHVNDPAPIPVRWSAAGAQLSDHQANIRRSPIGAADPAADSSDQPLDLEGDFDEIGPFFGRVPSQRLVVLGAPGAGKSALVLRLARRLLDARTSGAPVPVLLPIASWNPTEEDPWHWAARRLAALHPAVLRTAQLAHDLITTGRILPILDGFDELPEVSRPKALVRLRGSLNDPARLVLTCRIEEYEAAVEDADTVLPAAAVVQLQPLSVADLERYLPRTARPTAQAPTATKWTPVLTRLADAEDRTPEVETLRSVLSTPLMVSLARIVYTGTRADPTELIEDRRFREQTNLERHLYDAFLSAAYEHTGRAGWTGEQARGWAGYLAAHLRRTGEQDIAWWRLGEVVPRSVRWLGTGLSMVVAALAVGVTDYDHPWWHEWFPVPPWAAVLLLGGLTAVLDWAFDAPVDAPQRLNWPGLAELRGLRAEARTLLFAVLLVTMGIGVLVPLDLRDWALSSAIFGGIVLTLIVATRLIDLLNRLADPADAPEPAELLRADRRTQLLLGVFAPFRLPPRRILTEGLLILVSIMLVVWLRVSDRDAVSGADWALTLGLLLLAWMVCRWSVSASGRLSVARLYLSCTGALPWRVMAFLRDAHRRGVLRQSGGLYRFRHIELRNRLAEAAGVTEDGTSSPDRARREAVRPSLSDLMNPGPSVIGIAFGLSAAVIVPDFEFPYKDLPEPCALVSSAHVRELFVDRVMESEPEDGRCGFDERSPFRPDRRLTITSGLYRSFWSEGSGADWARVLMDDSAMDGEKPLAGLGDEATVLVDNSGPHKEPRARINVRAGNVAVWIEYSEEYAGPERVSEVAVVIAREALRRAGVPAEVTGTDRRALADVPPAKLPARQRTAAYRWVPDRSLVGPVWKGEEYSEIQVLKRLEVPVRVPVDFTCSESKKPLAEGDWTARCSNKVDDPPLLDMADLPCAATGCSAAVTDSFRQRWAGPGVDRWKRTGSGDGRYLERRTDKGEYELILFLPDRRGDREHQLWFRALVEKDDTELAQKMVNAAYSQVTGW